MAFPHETKARAKSSWTLYPPASEANRTPLGQTKAKPKANDSDNYVNTTNTSVNGPRAGASGIRSSNVPNRVAESDHPRGAKANSTPNGGSQTPVQMTARPTQAVQISSPKLGHTTSSTQPSHAQAQKTPQTPQTSSTAQKILGNPSSTLHVGKRGPSDAVASPAIQTPTQGANTAVRSVSAAKRLRSPDSNGSEDEGGNVRGKRPLKKRSKPNKDGRYMIGHHVNEPLLPVFASLRALSGGDTVHATRFEVEKTSDLPASITSDARWKELVSSDNCVHPDNIRFSNDVFADYADELGVMSHPRKIALVKDFLNNKKTQLEILEDEDHDEEVEETLTKYYYTPKYLEVGHYYQNSKVPIEAHVRKHASNATPSVWLMAQKEASRESLTAFPIRSIRDFSRIIFKHEFQKGKNETIEDLKKKILALFTRHVVPAEQLDPQNPSQVSQKRPRASEYESDSDFEPESDESQTPRTLGQKSRFFEFEDEIDGATTSVVRPPPPPVQTTSSVLAIGSADIESFMLSLLAFKGKFSQSRLQANKTENKLVKREIAAGKKDDELEQKMKAVVALDKDVKNRESAVKLLETKFKAMEDDAGAFKLSEEEKVQLRKEKAELELLRTELNNRKAAVQEARVAVEAREKVVKQGEVDILSRLTEVQIRDFVQNNTTIRKIVDEKVARKSNTKYEEMKKKFEQTQSQLKQRENQGPRMGAAGTAVHQFTPIRSAAPNAIQFQGTPKLSDPLSLIVPLPLLPEGAIFKEHFQLIPQGDPNAGMWMRTSGPREVTIDNKRFRVEKVVRDITADRFVTNPTLSVDGVKNGHVTHKGGYSFDHYVKGNTLKLVQQFSPKSFAFDKSKFFVSWYVYIQIENFHL